MPTNFTRPGVVYLVGAGPGDPGLMTVRGAALLAAADIVIYDALANPALLGHAPSAEHVYVGKRAASHSMTQGQINQLLVDHGTAGKIVVRLKGGDPFVFGRGGEECEALAAAGVRFEVVPGITAAIAAPAYAGIPVTHRDFNSSFTFLTGHEKEEAYQDGDAKGRPGGAGSDVDWAAVARLPCLAFYMGVKSLPRITAALVAHGMDPATPAATIQSGTWPDQRTVVATVGKIADAAAAAGVKPPAMTIVGRVVSMRPTMNWFENRPLFGKRVVVTRARDQASDLAAKLAGRGAEVIEAPAIELVPAVDPSAVEQALTTLAAEADWVIFTSVNGVTFTKRRLFDLGLDARAFGRAKVAAIGVATATAVRDHLSLGVDLCPARAVAESLSDDLMAAGDVAGKVFLMLRADTARPVLKTNLEGAGATVYDVPIYESRPVVDAPAELSSGRIDWVTFTSSGTVKNFLAMNGRPDLTGVKLASIGPVTTAAMAAAGLTATVEAADATIEALIAAIENTPAEG